MFERGTNDRRANSGAGARAPAPCVGALISNLKAVRDGIPGDSGLGTLGFLAAKRDAHDWRQLVLVSNHHVLAAQGGAPGDTVFQPNFTQALGGRRLLFDSANLNPIAEVEPGGVEGHHEYRYRGEPARRYFVDCATARLLSTRSSSRAAGRPRFSEVARVHRFDTFEGRELRVRKLGRDERFTGRIVDVAATVVTARGEQRQNCLVIRSLPGRGGGVRAFAERGDSGALLVDELNRAVGILWGIRLDDPREAYASHIHPVLDCLGVTPWRFDFEEARAAAAT